MTPYRQNGRTLLGRLFLLAACAVMFSVTAWAQSGKKVFQFVELPVSARIGALGGVPQAISEPDLNLASANPAFLSAETENKLAVNYVNYVAGISIADVAYSFHTTYAPGTLAAGLQYLNSGKNTRYDEFGNTAGSFTSNEWAVRLSYCQHFDSCFSIGATVKPVFSYIGGYFSMGLLADVSAAYNFSNNNTSASLLLRNFGAQIVSYDGNYSDTPFEILASVSHQLEHAPFRVSLVLQQMQKFNLQPKKANKPDMDSEVEDNSNKLPDFLDNCLRHCVLGVELFPDKTFNARFGFNYKRRQELKLSNKPGMAGVSLGFGLRLKRFSIEYANARYTLAGVSNHISLLVNLPK